MAGIGNRTTQGPSQAGNGLRISSEDRAQTALSPFLTGSGTAPDDWRTEVHWEWDFRSPTEHVAEDLLGITMEQCSVNVIRDAKWKYVHFAGMAPLLFDLAEDPDQFVDLAGDAAHAPVVAAYAQKLLSWRMRHADRTLTSTVLTPLGPITRVDPRVG